MHFFSGLSFSFEYIFSTERFRLVNYLNWNKIFQSQHLYVSVNVLRNEKESHFVTSFSNVGMVLNPFRIPNILSLLLECSPVSIWQSNVVLNLALLKIDVSKNVQN